MIITSTTRLYLRELNTQDSLHFFQLNQNPNVLQYTGDRPFHSQQEAHDFLANYTPYQLHGFGRWAVILKTNDEFIGWCGLKKNEEGLVDIGYRFFEHHWGKGLATEAARASLDYGFNTLELPKIVGRTMSDNKASIRVLEKIGMQFWKKDNCDGLGESLYYSADRI